MKKLVINQNLVNQETAQQLINCCPFGGFEYENGKLEFGAGCRSCGLCARKGPKGVVIQVEETSTVVQIDKSAWKGVAVYVEHNDQRVHPVSFELIGKAQELAKKSNHPVYAVLIATSEQVEKFKDQILSYGVDCLYIYQDPAFEPFNVEIYKIAMEDFINKVKPSSVIYGATAIGRSFAPRVAACFRTGLTADCTILDMKENSDLVQIRPAFGGNVMAQIVCPNHRPQMATVRPKIFKLPTPTTPSGEVKYLDLDPSLLKSNIKTLEIALKPQIEDVSEAEVIVACGRAFKTAEQMEQAYELAKLLGGMVAATRPLIEAGLIDNRYLVGLSGRSVAPKLIINLGISGAVQYTAGITQSETIISINSDPAAPIFGVSHYGIVGDVFTILPQLIANIKNQEGKK